MKRTEQSATIEVKRSFSVSGDEVHRADTDETIEVHHFVTEPARVGVSAGTTLNMGNYEAVRLDVSVQVPCYHEEVERAFEWAKAFAKNRLAKECKEARSYLKSKIAF